jgi:Trypsin-like peptidase domain
VSFAEVDGWSKLLRSIEHQSRLLGKSASLSPSSVTETPSGGSSADVDQLVTQVRTAVQASDPIGVKQCAAAIVDRLRHRGHGFTALQGRRIVSQLWSRHLSTLVQHVGDAFIRAGVDTPPIRRLYTDALLEHGWLTAAFDGIVKLQQSTLSDPTERALVGELQGRAHTAAFLATELGTPDDADADLWKGVEAYYEVYTSDPGRNVLHGARAAALVLRATRSGLPTPTRFSPGEIANLIRGAIGDKEEMGRPLDVDECEAAFISAIVLERYDEAVTRLRAYLSQPQVHVLNLRMLYAHLKDVWQFQHDTSPGSLLLPLLKGHLDASAQPWLELAAPILEAPNIGKLSPSSEVIFAPKFRSLTWYGRGQSCAESVARIETLDGRGIATGFLVYGPELHPSLPDEPLLLTNSYVVTNDQAVRDKYSFSVFDAAELRARFESDDTASTFEVIWSSFDGGTSILKLTSPVRRERHLKIASRSVNTQSGAWAFIIGHPGGRGLAYSDGTILDGDERLLHYRTPTEAGSAGSPVFDQEWKVVAVHYAGGDAIPRLHGLPGTYAANEGIRIEFIRKTIEAETGASQ